MDLKALYTRYVNSSCHQWWVDNVWRPSWTRVTTAIYGIPAGVLFIADKGSQWANDTTIQGYLSQLNIPNWVPAGLAGLALLHYVLMGHKD